MDVIAPCEETPCCGSICVEYLGEMPIGRLSECDEQVTARRSRVTWRPSADLDLPDGFELSFGCITGGAGIRRFFPTEGVESMVLKASLVGHAIVKQQGSSPELRFSYHAMRLIYQHAGRMRETFGRKFSRPEDLYVTSSARMGGETDVLPSSIGLKADGSGERWTVKEFLNIGRDAAYGVEASPPDVGTCIRTALLEAARRNPMKCDGLTPDATRRLMRVALFDLGPDTSCANDLDVNRLVMERLLAAVEKHIDDSTDEFHDWFFEKRDNLIRQISKKKRNGGPIDRTKVRQVLLEAVFESHEYVAQTMQLGLEMMLTTPSLDLSTDERDLFEALYCTRQEFGGFSLVMLKDRFANMREVVVEVINSPTDSARIEILLRVLDYLAEMTSKRRDADRQWKEASLHRNRGGRTAALLDVQQHDRPVVPQCSQLDAIALHLREKRAARCDCEDTDSWIVKIEPGPNSQLNVFNESCVACGHCESTQHSIKTLKKLVNEIADASSSESESDSAAAD